MASRAAVAALAGAVVLGPAALPVLASTPAANSASAQTSAPTSTPAPTSAGSSTAADMLDDLAAQSAAGDAAQAEADARYAEHYATAFGEAWGAGEVYMDPGASPFWDEKQQEIVRPMVEEAEAAGYTVRIALLQVGVPDGRDGRPALSGEHPGGVTPLLLSTLERYARASTADGPELLLLWDARYGYTFRAVAEGGTLTLAPERAEWYSDSSSLRYTPVIGDFFPNTFLNEDVPGPGIHHAIRTYLGRGLPIPEDVEAEPRLYGQETPGTYDLDETGPWAFVRAAFLGAVLVLVFVGGIVAALSALAGFLRGPYRARKQETTESSNTALRELYDRAVAADRALFSSSGRSEDLRQARRRLPKPSDSHNPVVWAAWVQLQREADAERSGEPAAQGDFFRPDLEATDFSYWDDLGADVEIPVTAESRDLLAGLTPLMPSYLSASGIDTGLPYWKEDSSPFASSGMGAFGSLAASITAMPAGWRPERGTVNPRQLTDGNSRATGSRTAGASRATGAAGSGGTESAVTTGGTRLGRIAGWGTWVALVLLVAVGGAFLAVHNAEESAKSASPAHVGDSLVDTPTNPDRVDAARAAIADDGVWVDPVAYRLVTPKEEQKVADAIAEADLPYTFSVVFYAPSFQDEFRGERSAFAAALDIPEDTAVLFVDADSARSTTLTVYSPRYTDSALTGDDAIPYDLWAQNDVPPATAALRWMQEASLEKWTADGGDEPTPLPVTEPDHALIGSPEFVPAVMQRAVVVAGLVLVLGIGIPLLVTGSMRRRNSV
ncbi:hypothetical protein GCM10009755_16030 [Brevibacterium samyangense]|uniref:DUF4350 domain-containing protein n=1 Tax=Brevibacterium samyangense TaxID=366888 RepID=A0ABP5EVB4_9MICO